MLQKYWVLCKVVVFHLLHIMLLCLSCQNELFKAAWNVQAYAVCDCQTKWKFLNTKLGHHFRSLSVIAKEHNKCWPVITHFDLVHGSRPDMEPIVKLANSFIFNFHAFTITN